MALGARAADVLRMVLRDGMSLAATGVVIGVVLAGLASRLISSFLYGVSPLDWLTFTGMSLALGAVALFATWLPARRAAAASPVNVLRAD
jgi:ABC-type antimicrobial peptide transport system permease subunit